MARGTLRKTPLGYLFMDGETLHHHAHSPALQRVELELGLKGKLLAVAKTARTGIPIVGKMQGDYLRIFPVAQSTKNDILGASLLIETIRGHCFTYARYFLSATVALVPPNPNEFEIAASRLMRRATFGT